MTRYIIGYKPIPGDYDRAVIEADTEEQAVIKFLSEYGDIMDGPIINIEEDWRKDYATN